MAQTTKDATDEDINEIQNVLNDVYVLEDLREYSTANTYMAFLACVYGFIFMIAMVSVLNIVNSISMSVSARMKQYGMMRAVGMEQRQITKMISAEAFTYAVLGCIVGCVIGSFFSKLIYDKLITTHYAYAVWSIPVIQLTAVLFVVIAATGIAIYAPAKRMRDRNITEIINEL